LEGGVLRGEEVRTYAEGNFEQKVTYPIVRLGKILYIGTLWDDSMRWIWTGVFAEILERILGLGVYRYLYILDLPPEGGTGLDGMGLFASQIDSCLLCRIQ
jgi:hypothetical protein